MTAARAARAHDFILRQPDGYDSIVGVCLSFVAAGVGFAAADFPRPLPELYAAAGASLVFEAPRMAELVDLVEGEIVALRDGLPPGGEVAPG